MRRLLWLLILAAAAVAQPIGGGSTGIPIACVGAPGNTVGQYRQQCQVATTAAVYACNNTGGCSVSRDWAPISGSGTFTALSGDATSTATGGATMVSKFNGGTAFGSAAAASTGTSGAVLCLLNANCTFSGTVGGISATMVGLGSVTNDAQTKNSLVPNSFSGFRFGNAGTADSAGTAAQVAALFSGCSGTQYLGYDGSCHTAAGSGTINSATQWSIPYYSAFGSASTLSGAAITGIVKGLSSGAPTAAAAADVYGLWTGTKDSSHCLAGDGSMQACAGGSGGANVTLSNLTSNSVALNTDLKPGSWGSVNLGTSALPFGTLTLTGSTSGQGGYAYLEAANADTAARTFVLPADSGTVALTKNVVTLQSSTPGTQQTGNINISGTIIAPGGFQGGTTFNASGGETSAPATPAVSNAACWFDSTDHAGIACMANNSASKFKLFLAGQDCNPVTGVCTKTNGSALTSASTTAIGTSGATIPLLSTANTWTLGQTFAATTNQHIFGAGSNLTTVNWPASSGAVTVTMPNTTSTVCTTVSCPGTVTSVGWTGGIVTVATATSTPAFTIAGTSGGHPYFSSGTTWASSGAGTTHGIWLAQGAGSADTTTAAGSSGQPLLSGGALADPSYGTLGIAYGGTNATSTAVGAVPNATSTIASSWTITPTLGNPANTTGTQTFANATGAGTFTVGASPSTTTNTMLGPTAVIANNHLIGCTTSSTACTMTDVTPNATLVGLSSVTNDVQTKNSIAPNTFTGIRVGTNGSADVAGTAHHVSGVLTCTTSSGSATAETCTTSPTFTPASGDSFYFVPDTANSGDFTLNPNSLGAKHLYHNGANLIGCELQVGTPVILYYNGTQFVMHNSPILIASGTTAASSTGSLNNLGSIASTATATLTIASSCVAATDVISFTPNASLKAVVGFTAATTGGITITAFPTAGNVNFDAQNWSTGALTIGTGAQLNWRVTR